MVRRREREPQSRFDIRPEEWLSAEEASALMDVKRATLYTYVSRGLVRCVPEPGTKAKRYLREDLERLRERHEARAGHTAVAANALRWGEPVIDSAISQVGAEGLAYRGHPAVRLAAAGTRFEDVAELLWTGTPPPEGPTRWPPPEPRPSAARVVALLPPEAAPLTVLRAVVPLLGARAASGEDPEQEHRRARHLLRALAAWVGAVREPASVARALRRETVAASLAEAWGVTATRAGEGLNRALVLCADHELNVSTFAARVTASSGADLHACVSAALAALSGPRHGGSCDRIEALMRDVGRPERARREVHARLGRGEAVPGFGHRLYPDGDPRTPPLLEVAYALRPERRGVRVLREVEATMREAGHAPPTVDFALVALATALGLPPGAATALFAVGRAAGWVAHVWEQREQGHVWRPRARYVPSTRP